MTLTKITVTGQYTPKHDKVNPLIIGGVTFNPYLELTANVKEDVFLNLLRGFRTPEPWFVLADHNYPEYIKSRRVPANPEIMSLLDADNATPDPQEEILTGGEEEVVSVTGEGTEDVSAGDGEEIPVDKTEEIDDSVDKTEEIETIEEKAEEIPSGEATPAEIPVIETAVEETLVETTAETEQAPEEVVPEKVEIVTEEVATQTVSEEVSITETAVETPTEAAPVAEAEPKTKRGKKSSK